MPRKTKLRKYAERIIIKGGDTVKTRMGRREFEKRAERFDSYYSDVWREYLPRFRRMRRR